MSQVQVADPNSESRKTDLNKIQWLYNKHGERMVDCQDQKLYLAECESVKSQKEQSVLPFTHDFFYSFMVRKTGI